MRHLDMSSFCTTWVNATWIRIKAVFCNGCGPTSARQMPEIWTVAGRKRVLDPTLDAKTQTLLLLYSDVEEAVPAEDLCAWTEYSSLRDFRRNVLRPLHASRLIEFDADTDMAILSPTGIARVETERLAGLPAGRSAPRVQQRRLRH